MSPISFTPSALNEGRLYEYLIRFVLGGAATVFTGWISSRAGASVGGLFLALPAIFCASATLIEKHEIRRKREAGLDGRRRGEEAAALESAGAANLANLDTILARGYEGGTDLSGGQWQRIALARALCAVRLGAGVVLLDEPTAQLDVRGEAEIFERMLAETRRCTTILISHRFSTVRHADRICVLEHGRVIELGTHDELMAKGSRYRTMFELQAKRFTAEEEEGATYDVLT